MLQGFAFQVSGSPPHSLIFQIISLYSGGQFRESYSFLLLYLPTLPAAAHFLSMHTRDPGCRLRQGKATGGRTAAGGYGSAGNQAQYAPGFPCPVRKKIVESAFPASGQSIHFLIFQTTLLSSRGRVRPSHSCLLVQLATTPFDPSGSKSLLPKSHVRPWAAADSVKVRQLLVVLRLAVMAAEESRRNIRPYSAVRWEKKLREVAGENRAAKVKFKIQ